MIEREWRMSLVMQNIVETNSFLFYEAEEAAQGVGRCSEPKNVLENVETGEQ